MSLASVMAPVLATLPTNSNGTCRLYLSPAELTVLETPLSPSLRAPTMTTHQCELLSWVEAGNAVISLLAMSTWEEETNAGLGH